ncbi:MAG TPA: hypothetical protein VIW03_00495, partial [Anaeromyxobacter sp.]
MALARHRPGAGWRARAAGLPAQCVLLDAAGCEHWREAPEPTSIDLRELARILGRVEVEDGVGVEIGVEIEVEVEVEDGVGVGVEVGALRQAQGGRP